MPSELQVVLRPTVCIECTLISGTRAWKSCTFHVQTLQHEQLVVARLVEKGRKPGLIPDARVGMPIFQVFVPRNHCHPWDCLEPGRHIRPGSLQLHKGQCSTMS